jgi:hypothetical protein
MGFGDIEIDEQGGDRFGEHAGAPIGMQDQRARRAGIQPTT